MPPDAAVTQVRSLVLALLHAEGAARKFKKLREDIQIQHFLNNNNKSRKNIYMLSISVSETSIQKT